VYDGEKCNSEEGKVVREPDKKRQRSCDDKYKVESQKKSCNSVDESEQLEFSFQKYYYELKVFLRDEDLVPDSEDFWKFLKNYEAVQKRAAGRKHYLGSAGEKELQIQVIFIMRDQYTFYIVKCFSSSCMILCIHLLVFTHTNIR
jgi:hypothetical protein